MKQWMRILALLLAMLLLAACAGNAPTESQVTEEPQVTEAPTAEPTEAPVEGEISVYTDLLKAADPIDDNNRVFYEIFVGSFSDSNGDGIGDLRGIINRMDYLNDGDPNSGRSLGVEGLWLSPIFKSPSYHKYDVTDYYTIDPSFGTMDDLKELLDLCHSRGVKVILDIVINHTSTACAWFKEFSKAHKNGDTDNEYYNFYAWYDADTEKKPSGRTFYKISGTKHYYECNFWDQMPEMNYEDPAVRQAVLDIAKFYFDLGVDGFRFDAAKYVYYGDNKKSVEFWNEYMAALREMKPDVYAVAEVWDGDGITDKYFPALNCFCFSVADSEGLIADIANKGDANRYTAYVESYQNRVKAMRADAAYTPFITNHDMDRAAGFLRQANGTIQVAANLYLLGPGSPFIYYGEELGMKGSRGGSGTDANRRMAMVWGDGDTVKNPEGTDYTTQITDTVEIQKKTEYSLYNYYKKVLMLRRANPEIGHGTYTAIQVPDSKVGCFAASLDGSTVLVLHNTSVSEQTIDLSKLYNASGFTMRGYVGKGMASVDGKTLTLEGQTSVVLRCE